MNLEELKSRVLTLKEYRQSNPEESYKEGFTLHNFVILKDDSFRLAYKHPMDFKYALESAMERKKPILIKRAKDKLPPVVPTIASQHVLESNLRDFVFFDIRIYQINNYLIKLHPEYLLIDHLQNRWLVLYPVVDGSILYPLSDHGIVRGITVLNKGHLLELDQEAKDILKIK